MTGGTVTVACQAHALHAAAMFLTQAAVAGLAVTVDATAFITIAIPDQIGSPHTRAGLVTTLAAAAEEGYTVRSHAPGQRHRYRTTGYGRAGGHPLAITTRGSETPWPAP